MFSPTRRFYALVGIIAVMLVWGSTFVVTKVASQEIPALTLAFLRFLIASVVLMPLAAGRGGLKSLPPAVTFRRLVLMAFTGTACFTTAFNYALLFGSASQGALIFALVPAFVAAAAAIFLKEILSRKRIAGIVLSVCGVALIIAASQGSAASPHPVLGALCMLAAVVAWTAYTIVAKSLADADQIVVIAWTSVAGAVILLPFAAMELWFVPWSNPSLRGWLGILFLGIVASGAAYVFYNRGLRELDASLVGVFVNLDPIVGLLTAFLFLGEVLEPWQGVGAVVALSGMWLASFRTP